MKSEVHVFTLGLCNEIFSGPDYRRLASNDDGDD
jgi:hypothetical protein